MTRNPIPFDVIKYVSSLTNFTFDKAVLERVAVESELVYCKRYEDIDEQERDMAEIMLLEVIVKSPWSTAAQTVKHGTFEQITGQQTVTKDVLNNVKDQLRRLYRKYGMLDKLDMIDDGLMEWVEETDY